MTAAPWIQTRSGRAFPLLNPSADDVHWRDMAVALGRLCRFGGHAVAFYSVAQHCVHADDVMLSAVRSTRGRGLLLSAVPPAARHDVQALFQRAELDDDTMRRLRLATLLHDGHEAYVGDIVTPVAQAISNGCGRDHVRDLKTRVDSAVIARAGLPWPLPSGWVAAIKAADLIMLATERRDLMADGPDWAMPLPASAAFAIKPMPEHLAADAFMRRLDDLLAGGV